MSDTDFERAAEKKFNHIFNLLDGEDGLDIDLQGGILTIEVEESGTYLVNKHGPSKEIWLSSPLSGAWHFRETGPDWLATKGENIRLDALLSEELTRLLRRQIKLA